MNKRIINFFHFIKQVFVEFASDNVLKYSASLAYCTVFSLAPMLIIIIGAGGFLFGQEAMEGRIYVQIKDLIGSQAAIQVQETIKNVHLEKASSVATVISVIALLVGATGIFGEMQDSLNRIWGLKLKARKVWWKIILNRLLSFSLVISLGFVLMVSLILNAIVAGIGGRLDHIISGSAAALVPSINIIMSLLINTFLFAIIFKILPDARIRWKDVFIGAVTTSVLFMLGRWAIGFYIGTSNMASIYGAAGSVIIILIWTYYSAAILYFGAEFTKVYAKEYGGKISPNDYSMWIKVEEIPVRNIVLTHEIKEKNDIKV
ncbi:MAG: YihY/virulence factor BrkB family protein [Ferruginibacter sp.]